MMVFLVLLLLSDLPCHSVSADPDDLAWLEEHAEDEAEIPAVLHLDSMDVQCTLAFRGGTSLNLEKRSWHIRLEDGEHILLNAQYRDPSLMRNTLGLYMTRALGLPAPLTDFVTFTLNGVNQGVYEQVERIDRLFYQRNGTGFGPLFKNVDTMGRLACQYADTCGIAGLEPKIDSQPYTGRVLELIEGCLQGNVAVLNEHEILAAIAVNTAIGDQDGLIKNFYLHQYSGEWHYYPWDRDATFGNSWKGEYDPAWTNSLHLHDAGYFGASRGFLEDPAGVQVLDEYLISCADLMEDRIPEMIDSLNLLLRDELAEDPYYEYTVWQFDSLCQTFSDDAAQRGGYLRTVSLGSPIPSIESWHIDDCLNIDDDQLEIELHLSGTQAESVVLLVSLDGSAETWHFMENDQRDRDLWKYELDVPEGTYSVNLVFGPRADTPVVPFFYPSWAMRGFHNRPSPAPGARVALAPLSPGNFTVEEPVWCGDNLWVLPVRNRGSEPQDISHCSFLAGEPSGSIFLRDSVIIQPGETFYLTSDAGKAIPLFSGQVFGDAGTAFPSGTDLILQDPSWNSMYSWRVSGSDSLPPGNSDVIPCELSLGSGADWVELYNRGTAEADMSGWYLMDSEFNVSMIPDGTTLASGQLLLFSADPPGTGEGLLLDFSLDSSRDTLSLFNREGSQVFRIGWNPQWPVQDTGIIYLSSPARDFHLSGNWLQAVPPGTPGEPNPGWDGIFESIDIHLVSENPCNGTFSFSYSCTSPPAEAAIYDLAGRRIAGIPLTGSFEGTVTADFSGTLPSGVYIIHLRTSTGADTARLTVLTGL